MFIDILIGIIILLIMLECLLALYAFNRITRDRNYKDEECLYAMNSKGFDFTDIYRKLQKDEVYITSRDGLKLRGIYVEGNPELNKTMIIVHGYMVSSAWSLQFTEPFFKEGWNILLVDMRRHGKSQGRYSTYGYMEKYDLDAWVNWIVEKNGENSVIGVHGQSMGAGTVLEYASINKYVKFIIADCPYSDMKKLIVHVLKQNHIFPYPLLYIVDFMLSIRAKFKMKDVSPINSIKNSDTPIMFIHGSDDNFVPTYMSREMFDAKPSFKKLLIVDGAIHGTSYLVNRELYQKEMMDFIHEVLTEDNTPSLETC